MFCDAAGLFLEISGYAKEVNGLSLCLKFSYLFGVFTAFCIYISTELCVNLLLRYG